MKIQLVLFLFPFIVLMGKDPFDTFYQKGTMRIFSLEGKIRSLSPLPDPQKNDYPDCLYSAMVEVDSFSCPDNADQRIAKEIIVNIPVMRSKKIFVQNVFRAGDKISVKCVQYDIMPEKIRNIQVSDSFQSFEHDYFYVIDAKKYGFFQTKADGIFQIEKFPSYR